MSKKLTLRDLEKVLGCKIRFTFKRNLPKGVVAMMINMVDGVIDPKQTHILRRATLDKMIQKERLRRKRKKQHD